MIEIAHLTPFSKGGNRLCFVHPDNPARCLKVAQPHRTAEKRREAKGFFARFRPVSYFDENLQDHQSLEAIHRQSHDQLKNHFPVSYGLVETDLGTAHDVDLIRDEDHRISQTLEQYLWNEGHDELIGAAIEVFRQNWISRGPRTRDLLPHNFLIQVLSTEPRLILIDGFGSFARDFWRPAFSKHRGLRQIERFDARIQEVLRRRSAGEEPKPRIVGIKRDA